MKNYYYDIDGIAKGVYQAKSKREVRNHCYHMASIFFPTHGVKKITIKKMKHSKPLVSE